MCSTVFGVQSTDRSWASWRGKMTAHKTIISTDERITTQCTDGEKRFKDSLWDEKLFNVNCKHWISDSVHLHIVFISETFIFPFSIYFLNKIRTSYAYTWYKCKRYKWCTVKILSLSNLCPPVTLPGGNQYWQSIPASLPSFSVSLL